VKTALRGSLLPCVLGGPLLAARIVIVNIDPPGQGFNDPAPTSAVGGNMAATIGGQRLVVFEEAARIWGRLLPGDVPIRVEASFRPLPCNSASAVLGVTTPSGLFANFPGAPLPDTAYPKALADRLAGREIDASIPAVRTTFNSELGKAGCLNGLSFYYGLDDNAGTSVHLLTIALHELAHGLGFARTVDARGAFTGPRPGIFERLLLDTTSGRTWDQMTDRERVFSAANTGNVVWAGPNAAAWARSSIARVRRLLISAPAEVAGSYQMEIGRLGGGTIPSDFGGEIVAALSGAATDGCTSITSDVAGKIALVDLAGCGFAIQTRNAQDAGAIGILVAATFGDFPTPILGAPDPTISIPTITLGQGDGARLRAHLPASARVAFDPLRFSGADASGRLRMFAPGPLQGGSAISHWDTSATPNLLMEPFIAGDVTLTTDATLPALADMGWLLGPKGVTTEYLLPSSARLAGAGGAFFTTDLTIANRGATDAAMTMKFLGHEQDGRGGPEATRTLPAGTTVSFPDVLRSVFGLTSDYGAIRITADSAALRVVSETSTPGTSGAGSSGQAVPGQTANDFVTTAFPRVLAGLRQDEAFRTNAVIANATEAPARVDLALQSAEGDRLGGTGFDLGPLEMRQISGVLTALGAPRGTAGALLVVSTPTQGALVATYAAVIDNVTNDPRTIPGEALGAARASASWVLPSSARAGGAHGAFYTTDLTVANLGTRDVTFTLKFLGHDQDGRSGTESVRTLAAGTTTVLTDVLGSVFGVAGGFGAIRITADSSALRIVSQTSTPPPSGLGTFGQAVPALGPDDFVTSAAPRSLVGVREDEAFRTNAVVVNALDAPAHVELSLISESGETLGAAGYDLKPFEMRQVGGVVSALGGPPGTKNAVLVVSTSTATARIATYATVIDNLTNDPRTILP
jgi:hypothetical protein